MNGGGKGKPCRDDADRGLLLLLLFAEKKSEGHGKEIGRICIGRPFPHEVI